MRTVSGVGDGNTRMGASWDGYNGNRVIPDGSIHVVEGISVVFYTAIVS